MPRKSSLSKKLQINQFLFELRFFLYFSKLVLKHVEQFIKGIIQKGYQVTINDIILLSIADYHRTTFGKFLSKGVSNVGFA